MCIFKITCLFSVFLFRLSSLSMPSLSSVHFCTSLSPLFVFSSIYLPLSFHSPFLGICPNVCLLVSSCGSRFCSLSVLELIHLESVLKHQPGAPSLPPFCFFILLLYSNPVLFQSVAFSPFSAFPLPVACHYLLDFFLSWCVLMCFSAIFCLLLCFCSSLPSSFHTLSFCHLPIL